MSLHTSLLVQMPWRVCVSVCVCVCVCACWSLSGVCLFGTITLQAPLSMELSRQQYWSGSHSLLLGTPPPNPTQGLNPCLLQCRKTLYHLSHQESPPSKWSPFIWGKRKWSEQKPINFLERWDLEYVKSMNRRELYMLFLWHGNDWKQIAHKIIKSYCNRILKKTASLAKEKPETIWPSNSKAAHIPNSALGK